MSISYGLNLFVLNIKYVFKNYVNFFLYFNDLVTNFKVYFELLKISEILLVQPCLVKGTVD